jgi:hypothetical protein
LAAFTPSQDIRQITSARLVFSKIHFQGQDNAKTVLHPKRLFILRYMLYIHILSKSFFSKMRIQLSAENEKKTVRFSVDVGRRATKIK